ncbi:MAG: BTAD domain-containing putative transcriptional regulator [Casimicrobiaceae bacterium]
MARAHRNGEHAADPRSLLARGLSESHRGEVRALQTLAAAKECCVAARDPVGAALCAAASMVTGQALNNFRRFGEHIAALSGLRDESLHFADHGEELLAYAGMLAGLAFFHPGDPLNDRCAQRIMTLLELDADVNLRFAAGRLVLYYTEPREQRELGQRAYSLLQPHAADPALTPHRLGRWLIFWSRITALTRDHAQNALANAQARQLVERHAEPEVTMWIAANDVGACLARRDFERITAAMKTVEAAADPANLNDLGRMEWLRGRIALMKGEAEAALFHASRARKYAEELELPAPMLGVRVALEAQARLLAGDLPRARAGFVETAAMVAVLHAEEMRDMVRMVDAYAATRARRPDATALLAAAFAAPRARQFYDSFDTSPAFGATMCALALERGVDVEFVRRVIEVHRMAPPRDAGATWPWPIRIVTFGGFELVRDGAPLAVTGKIPKKPLELLKALIALSGRGVDKTRLADFLWPDAEPPAAIAALDMAISRLRKVLGHPEALHLDDGKLGLDTAQVWVDVWAFDRDVEALQTALRATADTEAEVVAIGERLLAAYRGAFLDNEEPQRWMLAARDRWRNRFVRSLADAGRYWERHERWPEAIALYERGIEVDTLAEDLYRRSMRCHLAHDQPAEAARVYRRCREMLSVQLGIAPSAETETLFQSIYKRATGID